MPGRRPKPKNLKIAQGNPGKRAINHDEPNPRAEIPEPPKWLEEMGRKHWYQLVPELRQAGILTIIDGDTLAEYCQLWAYQAREHEFMKRHATKRYGAKPLDPKERSHLLRTILLVSQQLTRLQSEFGMTPSSRTKIKVDKVKPDDSLEAKFFGKKTTGM